MAPPVHIQVLHKPNPQTSVLSDIAGRLPTAAFSALGFFLLLAGDNYGNTVSSAHWMRLPHETNHAAKAIA
jgi:hypothetical protein